MDARRCHTTRASEKARGPAAAATWGLPAWAMLPHAAGTVAAPSSVSVSVAQPHHQRSACHALRPQQAVLAPSGAYTVPDQQPAPKVSRARRSTPYNPNTSAANGRAGPAQGKPGTPEAKTPGSKAPSSRQAAAAAGSPAQQQQLAHQQLTQILMDATSWEELHGVCMAHSRGMNYINAATAINRLAKLLPEPSTLPALDGTQPPAGRQRGPSSSDSTSLDASIHTCITDICDLAAKFAPEFQPRAAANALWAVSKVLVNLPTPAAAAATDADTPQQAPVADAKAVKAHRSLITLAQQLLTLLPQCVAGFEPQHHANALYALGLMHATAQQQPQLPLLAGLPEGSLQSLGRLVLQHSLPHLANMTTQGVSNMLWGAAQLGVQPSEGWMDAALDSLQSRTQHMEPQHVSSSLWALAKMGFYPGDDWVDSVVGHAITYQLPDFSPQALSNTLWALATLQSPPQPQQLELLLAGIEHAALGFGPQDMSNTLWALASLQQLLLPTPKADATPASGGELSGSEYFKGPQDNGAVPPAVAALRSTGLYLLYACSGALPDMAAVMGTPPPAGAQQPQQAKEVALTRASPQQVANTLWAVSKLQLAPAPRWYQLFWRASYAALPAMSSQEVANTLLALGRLGVAPPEAWWHRAELASARTMPHALPQHLACTAWAMSELGLVPGDAWLHAFMRQVQAQRHYLNPQAVACILISLAKLQANVGPAWLCHILNPGPAPSEHTAFPPDSSSRQSPPPFDAMQPARSQRVSVEVDGTRVWDGYAPKELVSVVWATARLLRACEAELRADGEAGTAVSATNGEEMRQQQLRVCESLLPLLYALEQQLKVLLPAAVAEAASSSVHGGAGAQQAPQGEVVGGVGQETVRAVALLTWSVGRLIESVERWGAPHNDEEEEEHDEQVLLLAIMHALLDELCHAAAPCGPELTPGLLVQLVTGLSAARHKPTPGSGLLRSIRKRITHLARARVVGALEVSAPPPPSASETASPFMLPTDSLAAPGQMTPQQLAFLIKALAELGCALKPGWVQTCVELVRCLKELEGCVEVAAGRSTVLPDPLQSREVQSLAAVMAAYGIVLGGGRGEGDEEEGEAEEVAPALLAAAAAH